MRYIITILISAAFVLLVYLLYQWLLVLYIKKALERILQTSY